MDLAEKLANVDMTADNRISEEDRKYGETHQKAYETALSDLKGDRKSTRLNSSH